MDALIGAIAGIAELRDDFAKRRSQMTKVIEKKLFS
jgi:hypothetical protein